MSNYIIPGEEPFIAAGVRGYTVEPSGSIGPLYVPLVIADNPGNGDVSRYLDALPVDRIVIFPQVMSTILVGMLLRRGFALTEEWTEEFGEMFQIYKREAR